jgi:hypothetical protein
MPNQIVGTSTICMHDLIYLQLGTWRGAKIEKDRVENDLVALVTYISKKNRATM